MTTLGQAYVQIMPSAKGISGSIQNVINPEATKAGKGAGSRIATSISKSMGSMGKTFTKAITVPAVTATTAVTGLVGALGFKRLIGMDNAQAKLKGLGIEGKQLEIVMENAKDAVTGTTHTMADGADVAAGALAAGVAEGKELERFIKLVGDAATGSNRPMGDMAQIFNRVQGSGKLMTMELNQIEHGMPGFSQALAKHLGVASEDMREMVTDGKVSTQDFLETMEGFAGGMSEAYAGTWTGLKDNILSNIGIIGEAMLQGLFKDGKEGMADFLDFLRNSDGLKEWATETGEKIRETFNTIIEAVKDAIAWWKNLDDGTKSLIGKIAAVAVAIGPVLIVLGKVIGVITAVVGAIGAITPPIAIAIGVIAGLVAIGVLLYQNWETIKEKAIDVFSNFTPLIETLQESLTNLKSHFEPIMENLLNLWESLKPLLEVVGALLGGVVVVAFGLVVGVINGVINALGPLINAIINFVDIVVNMVNAIVALFTGDFAGAWQFLQDAGQSTLDFFVNLVNGIIDLLVGFVDGVIDFFYGLYMTLVGNSIVPDMVNAIADWFLELVGKVISFVVDLVENVIIFFTGLKDKVVDAAKKIASGVINKFVELKDGTINKIKETASNVIGKFEELKNNAVSKITDFVSGIREKFDEIKQVMKDKVSEAVTDTIGKIAELPGKIKEKATDFFNAGKNIVTSIADGIKAAIGKVTDAIGNVAQKARDFLPFSPPKTGPLRDIMDVKWGETIGAGIEDGEDEVAKAMDNILDFDITKKAKFNNPQNTTSSDAALMKEQNKLLRQLVNKDTNIMLDGRKVTQSVNDRQGTQYNMNNYLAGNR